MNAMNCIALVLFMATLAGFGLCDVAHPLIIGGTPAQSGDIPWIVSLSATPWAGTHFCGGTILNARNILTAAHCVRNLNATKHKLKARTEALVINTGGVQYQVADIVSHPQYDYDPVPDYDVAVLHMASDIAIDGTVVKAVALPTGLPHLADRTEVRAAGWGYYMPDGPALSYRLMYVDIPIVGTEECSTSWPGYITDRMICAGEEGNGTCIGDSGGPITKDGVQYGVVSWGPSPCTYDPYPGVYADVVALLTWITANMV